MLSLDKVVQVSQNGSNKKFGEKMELVYGIER
jgi:hypothetical protein